MVGAKLNWAKVCLLRFYFLLCFYCLFAFFMDSTVFDHSVIYFVQFLVLEPVSYFAPARNCLPQQPSLRLFSSCYTQKSNRNSLCWCHIELSIWQCFYQAGQDLPHSKKIHHGSATIRWDFFLRFFPFKRNQYPKQKRNVFLN